MTAHRIILCFPPRRAKTPGRTRGFDRDTYVHLGWVSRRVRVRENKEQRLLVGRYIRNGLNILIGVLEVIAYYRMMWVHPRDFRTMVGIRKYDGASAAGSENCDGLWEDDKG